MKTSLHEVQIGVDWKSFDGEITITKMEIEGEMVSDAVRDAILKIHGPDLIQEIKDQCRHDNDSLEVEQGITARELIFGMNSALVNYLV